MKIVTAKQSKILKRKLKVEDSPSAEYAFYIVFKEIDKLKKQIKKLKRKTGQ